MIPQKIKLHRITGVEEVASAQTYDIAVNKVHAFSAKSESGLISVSHNSACINLFSVDDVEMSNAKVGDWSLTNPQRARSNNSALLIKDETTHEQFSALFKHTREFGEPGFVWAHNKNICFNPCVTADTLVSARINGLESTVRIDELICAFNGGEAIEVLSVDTDSMIREWSLVTNGAKTRVAATVISIETEDGHILKCTPDHLIWTNNRGYVKAADLNSDDDVEIA